MMDGQSHQGLPLLQAVPFLEADSSTARPSAGRPLGPFAPPVGCDISSFFKAVGSWHIILFGIRKQRKKVLVMMQIVEIYNKKEKSSGNKLDKVNPVCG